MMIVYDPPLYRPPSEAYSLIFQATLGCSFNKCRFCHMYKDKPFRVKPWDDLKAEIDDAARIRPDTKRIFLADGDAFVLSTPKLERILEYLYKSFPGLQRVAAYATPQNLVSKSVDEMARLRERGLTILYYGIESGDPEVLRKVEKGTSPEEIVEGCLRAKEAGIKLSVTVILGLGGKRMSMQHARGTAGLLNKIQPRFLSTLSLMLGPYRERYRTEMGEDFEFTSSKDDIVELRTLIEHLETDKCIFRSNHASNYLPLKGTLLGSKERLLAEIDRALDSPETHFRKEWMRGL